MPKDMAPPSGQENKQEQTNFDRLDLARFILACNAQRDRLIPDHQWGEPSWDILLQVYVSQTEHSGFDRNRHTADSTDRRYVDLLEQQGLLEKLPNSADKSLYGLTPPGRKALENWLDFCTMSKS